LWIVKPGVLADAVLIADIFPSPLGQTQHFRNDIGVFLSEIRRLGKICFQIEEQGVVNHNRIFRKAIKFPAGILFRREVKFPLFPTDDMVDFQMIRLN
jgi:hypothetical protein